MTSVWAMPALELLQHASVHQGVKSAQDQRIAFVSIDNALETVLGTYLEVVAPENEARAKDLPANLPRAFPARLELVEKLEPTLFTHHELLQIEYYHRIRNHIYHHGIGGGVAESTTTAYFELAKRAFETLLSAVFSPQGNRLENLTSEARAELEEAIRRHVAHQHGKKTRAGAERARSEGRLGRRGQASTGVRPDERDLVVKLYREKSSYKSIADELSRRRRKKRESPSTATVAWQKVRRKLIEVGEVPTQDHKSKPQRAKSESENSGSA